MELIRPFAKAWPITQTFFTKVTYMRSGIHSGIDFAMPTGTELLACFDGTVIQTDSFALTGYGRAIYIQSKDDPRYVALYGHCSKHIAIKGSHVKKGEIIALSGRTGFVIAVHGDGAHLHFGLKLNGAWIDPLPLMKGYGLPLEFVNPPAKKEEPMIKIPVTEKKENYYIVEEKDSLYKISAKIYNTSNRWKEIYELNKDIIKNPKKIQPGWKLRLPN